MMLNINRQRRVKRYASRYLKPVLVAIPIVFLFLYFFTGIFNGYKEANVHQYRSTDRQVLDTLTYEPIDWTQFDAVENAKRKTLATGLYKQNDQWWTYPANPQEVTRSGDDLLVLVNKQYKLPSTYAPKDLVLASSAGIRVSQSDHMVRSILIEDLKQLNTKAKADGINLIINSSYRSYASQIVTYNHWLAVNGGNVSVTDTISARPGFSQHQLGTAIDFSSSEVYGGIGEQFSNSKTAKWLLANAWKFGFVISYPAGYETTTRYAHEWWHYRYIGRDNAKEMVENNMIEEMYLREKNGL